MSQQEDSSKYVNQIPLYWFNDSDGNWFRSRGTGTAQDFAPHDRAFIEYHTGVIKRIYKDSEEQWWGVTLDKENPEELNEFLEVKLSAAMSAG